ncbi:MAG: serine hydrolase domain-containing protein [Hyphomicrobiales bacterium]
MKKIRYISIISVLVIATVIFLLTSIDSSGSDKPVSKYKPEVIDTKQFITNLNDFKIQDKSSWIDSVMNRMKQITGLNGTFLYADQGNVIYERSFGYSDLRKRTKMQTTDTFQLASVSKMFTATAILILVQEGKLDLDDDFKTFYSNFPYEGITVRSLLNHRSGLPRYMSIAHEFWEDKNKPLTNEDVVNLFIEHPVPRYFAPLHNFHYCNTNYALLANIVEKVSGVPFDIYVKEKIFRPAGMKHSLVYNMNGDTIVEPYIKEGVNGYLMRRYPRIMRNDYLNGVMGDKNVYSTIEDLFLFDNALRSQTLLNDSLQQLAYTPGTLKTRRKNLYGFGWRIKPDRDSTVYHFGWWKGFRTFFIRDLAQEKTIVLLTNTDKGIGSEILWKILDNKENDLPPMSRLYREEDHQNDIVTDFYKGMSEYDYPEYN